MADPLAFHEYQPLVRPPWHGGPVGQAWHEASGLLKDGIAEGARQAVYQRWVKTCADDALVIHGRDLGWPMAPGETIPEYRSRLLHSRYLDEWRGTAFGITEAFRLLGMTDVEVIESFTPGWGRHLNGMGDVEPSRARWINVIVRHPHKWGTDFGFRYGDGSTYGSGKLYGVNGDGRWGPLLQQLVRRQKPAHVYCEWIAIVLAGDIIHSNSANDGKPDGGSARVAYLPVP
jgi:hypothetical protein